jgi:GNAT superfamily N-acetyltransferase
VVVVSTQERVDAFWSRTFDLPDADLHRSGVTVVAHTGARAAWHGIYVLAFGDAAHVFAPTALSGRLTDLLDGRDATAVLEPKTWYELLGDAVERILGPSVHHYRDDVDGLTAGTGRRLNPSDVGALAELRGAADPDEWEEAGFTDPTPLMFGLFDDAGDGPLLAAANLTSGPEPASDVGVYTHPDRRGNGHGSRIAATAARQSLRMNGIARYRARAGHRASLSVAQKLGFREYGRNLTIHLTASV